MGIIGEMHYSGKYASFTSNDRNAQTLLTFSDSDKASEWWRGRDRSPCWRSGASTPTRSRPRSPPSPPGRWPSSGSWKRWGRYSLTQRWVTWVHGGPSAHGPGLVDLDIWPSCPTTQPFLPNSHRPKPNRGGSGTTNFKVNPTQREQIDLTVAVGYCEYRLSFSVSETQHQKNKVIALNLTLDQFFPEFWNWFVVIPIIQPTGVGEEGGHGVHVGDRAGAARVEARRRRSRLSRNVLRGQTQGWGREDFHFLITEIQVF